MSRAAVKNAETQEGWDCADERKQWLGFAHHKSSAGKWHGGLIQMICLVSPPPVARLEQLWQRSPGMRSARKPAARPFRPRSKMLSAIAKNRRRFPPCPLPGGGDPCWRTGGMLRTGLRSIRTGLPQPGKTIRVRQDAYGSSRGSRRGYEKGRGDPRTGCPGRVRMKLVPGPA